MPFSHFALTEADHASGDLLPGAGEYVGIDATSIIEAGAPEVLSFSWTEVSDPDTIEFLNINGTFTDGDHRSYHYRFILVPNPLTVNNPTLNVDIPYFLWNTFPLPDTAINKVITGSSVLTTDLLVGETIRDFEWAEYNIQIGPGESEINAVITVTWSQGISELTVIGQLIIDIPLIAEEPTNETWKWMTSITTAWDGTEQRIRLAPHPRRTIDVSYITDESDLVDLSTRLRQSNVGRLVVPLFQYEVLTTQASLIGSDELFFTPEYSHFQVGDLIYARSESDDDTPALINRVASMTPTGCIIEGSLGRAVPVGYLLTLAVEVFTSDPQQSFKSKSGTLTIVGQDVNVNRPLLHDSSTVTTLPTFGGRPVISQPILADITEGFRSAFETFDNSFGLVNRESSWTRPKFTRAIRFGSRMTKDHLDYDQWMLFFDTIAGAHKSFYLPSGVSDMTLAELPTDGEFTMLVQGNSHSLNYSTDPSRTQLEIQFEDKTKIWYNITQAIAQPGGNDLITLELALPEDVSTNPIVKISYLYWVRLLTDEVQVQYRNNRAYFSFAVIGVEN